MNIYRYSCVKIFTFVIAFALFVLSACSGSATPEKVGEIEERVPAPTQSTEEPLVEDPTAQSAEETPTVREYFVYSVVGTNQTLFYNNTSVTPLQKASDLSRIAKI